MPSFPMTRVKQLFGAGVLCVVACAGITNLLDVSQGEKSELLGIQARLDSREPILSEKLIQSATVQERRDLIFGASSPVLKAVSSSAIFSDSKDFVDMPLRRSPEAVLEQFHSLLDYSGPSGAMGHLPERLQTFLEMNFIPAGSDLEAWAPPDLPYSSPVILAAQDHHFPIHPNLAAWIQSLHELWNQLGRAVSKSVEEHPERHTLLPRKHPFIVPGGRFREGYYWDSLWIVKGLIASGAKHTAAGMVHNLLDDVERSGFVPNGGRSYYADRSQPPLLSEMVMALRETGYVKLLPDSAVELLMQEHAWWMDPNNGKTVVLAVGGSDVVLNRYFVEVAGPRPESMTADEEVVSGLGRDEAQRVWQEVSAAAESGWDFSSRWIVDGGSSAAGGFRPASRAEFLRELETTQIIPVDLNVILLRMERNIAALLEDEGRWGAAGEFSVLAQRRAEAIALAMWNEASASWKDLVIEEASGRTRSGLGLDVVRWRQRAGDWLAASDFLPIWGGLCEGWDFERVKRVVDALAFSGLAVRGGVMATTNLWSKEQWDGPNAWAPLQSLLIQGLNDLEHPAGTELARQLAARWLATNYMGWRGTGFMFEKYDAARPGWLGMGGEYDAQKGFGWTNGVALDLMRQDPELLSGTWPGLPRGSW